MGNCGEDTAASMGISREAQDEYTVRSYTTAAESYKVCEKWVIKTNVKIFAQLIQVRIGSRTIVHSSLLLAGRGAICRVDIRTDTKQEASRTDPLCGRRVWKC